MRLKITYLPFYNFCNFYNQGWGKESRFNKWILPCLKKRKACVVPPPRLTWQEIIHHKCLHMKHHLKHELSSFQILPFLLPVHTLCPCLPSLSRVTLSFIIISFTLELPSSSQDDAGGGQGRAASAEQGFLWKGWAASFRARWGVFRLCGLLH